MRTYGSLALLETNQWEMTSIPPHVAIRLKHVFPRIPKAKTEVFHFPNDPMHCADLAWFCQRYPMEIMPGDAAALQAGKSSFQATQAELEAILKPDYKPGILHGLKEGQHIRPYQSQAIEVIRRRKRLLLGDDLGLGKTYTSAGMILLSEARPAAVVVQTHLQKQWEEKITSFTSLTVHKIKGTRPYNLPPADVYIFRYSQILGWVDFFSDGFFKSVTYDEIQELRRGTDSGKGMAAWRLSAKADFCLGLSATPIYNYGTEIWNILQFVDKDVLGSSTDFDREWTGNTGVIQQPEALGTYLREQHVFLRRTKRDVGQQVPPINRLVEIIPTDHQPLAEIEELARALAMATTTGAFEERGRAARELDLRVRHATGVAKAKPVAAYVRILLDAGIPVLLMGWHRDVYEVWLRELRDFNPVMYTGSESPAAKEWSKKSFIEGGTNLLIMSLRSGAGLDGLQFRCSTVVFGELDWSPKVHDQVIGRLDREGQQEQVTAIYLNSEDGSDPPMVDLLGIKASQGTGITDPGRAFETVHSDGSRIQALAKRYLEKRPRVEVAAL